METIIVELSLPATNHDFDFALPTAIPVRDIIGEMVRVLTHTELNISFDEQRTMLCDVDSGRVLEPFRTLAEQGLRDGQRLILL